MPPRNKPFPPLELNARSAAPVYLQIFHQVQRLASTGRLRSGDQLPTVRELALHLGVNFNTVARAYRLLYRAGVVVAQQGRGTFVLDARLKGRGSKVALHALASQYITESRHQGFSSAQIAAAVVNRLTRQARAGEKDG